MNRRVLVTRGAGFIGSAVVRHLIEHTDHDVFVLDKLTYAGNLDSLASVVTHHRHRFLRGDVADQPRMTNLFERFKPDLVMHLAAETHVDRSIDGPSEFIRRNIF
jgi:dTDP-glucose 4,6-dehydratase